MAHRFFLQWKKSKTANLCYTQATNAHAKLAKDAQFCAHNVHVRDMPVFYTRAPFLSKSTMDPARKNKAILFLMLIDLGWDAVLRAAACI